MDWLDDKDYPDNPDDPDNKEVTFQYQDESFQIKVLKLSSALIQQWMNKIGSA